MPLQGLQNVTCPTVEKAVLFFLVHHYPINRHKIERFYNRPKPQRNRQIIEAYHAGKSVAELASEYGISIKRIYQIIQVR